MVNWLKDVTLTPKLKTAFDKGGVDGVYPRNLKIAYPAFLAIVERKTRQEGTLL